MNLCPFCNLPGDRVMGRSMSGFWFWDGYPVSPGHALVIPQRHVQSLFDLSAAERDDLWSLLEQAKRHVDEVHRPDGYNIGINDGPAAGQTVPHLHVHLIPRYRGDQIDPRGGVRWVFPGKANYWSGR